MSLYYTMLWKVIIKTVYVHTIPWLWKVIIKAVYVHTIPWL